MMEVSGRMIANTIETAEIEAQADMDEESAEENHQYLCLVCRQAWKHLLLFQHLRQMHQHIQNL